MDSIKTFDASDPNLIVNFEQCKKRFAKWSATFRTDDHSDCYFLFYCAVLKLDWTQFESCLNSYDRKTEYLWINWQCAWATESNTINLNRLILLAVCTDLEYSIWYWYGFRMFQLACSHAEKNVQLVGRNVPWKCHSAELQLVCVCVCVWSHFVRKINNKINIITLTTAQHHI